LAALIQVMHSLIEVLVGLEITHIHAGADPGDAERFILAEAMGIF